MKFKGKLKRLTRRYSEGGAQPPSEPQPAPAPQGVPAEPPAEPPTPAPAPNYEELLKTDKALQSLIDKQVTKAVQTAVSKDRERTKLLNDAAADENSKLAVMTPEQREEYWKRKVESISREYETKETGRVAKEKAIGIFEKEKIPLSLLELHPISDYNDDFTAKLMSAYSQYEFFPKGSFEKAVSEGIDKRLGQEPPTTVTGGGTKTNDPFLRGFDG